MRFLNFFALSAALLLAFSPLAIHASYAQTAEVALGLAAPVAAALPRVIAPPAVVALRLARRFVPAALLAVLRAESLLLVTATLAVPVVLLCHGNVLSKSIQWMRMPVPSQAWAPVHPTARRVPERDASPRRDRARGLPMRGVAIHAPAAP